MTTYPLASSTWDDRELDAIQKVIASDMYTMGAEVAAYEKEFAEFIGSKFAVMASSGSTANLIMTAALFFRKEGALQRGDEVIVPAVSWSTTYFPLQQYGLKVRFVDIDPDTLNMDLRALESAITERTRAILCVNLLGNPNDFNRIQSIIGDRNIVLLEDNCESMGATLDGRQAGTFGAMGTFSSFFSHHIATMEGGMVVTDDEELYHILLCLRAHGWTRNLPKFNHVTGEKSDDPFEESFKFVLPGYNVRPLEMSGAIGREQIRKLPEFVRIRRANAEIFTDVMQRFPYFRIQKETGSSSWFGFSMVIQPDAPFSRKDVVKALMAGGVDCRPIVTGNFVKNECLKYFDYDVVGELPVATEIDELGLFIGNHQVPLDNEIAHFASVLDSLPG